MTPLLSDPRWRWLALVILLLLTALAGAWRAAPALIAKRLRSLAADHGLTPAWSGLSIHPPLAVSIRDLSLRRAAGDTTASIATLEFSIDPWSLLAFAPRPSRLALGGARITTHSRAPQQLDAAPPAVRSGGRLRADRLPQLRETARRAARLLMSDPASFSISLRNINIFATTSEDEPRMVLRLDSLELKPQGGGTRLVGSGIAGLEDNTPFTVDATASSIGAVVGRAEFRVGPDGRPERLAIGLNAHLHRGGSPSALRLERGSTINIGPIPLDVSGSLDPAAPRIRLDLAAHGVDPGLLARKLPPTLLGPLAGLKLRGSFDYALTFDLDLEHPDSVTFHADVTPHGLSLDPAGTRLNLLTLDAPFVAAIHLPHGRIVIRDLSHANPHFRTYDTIDSTLALALVTNEDGGFFRHRGFNTDAVKDAIAENLHAGAFRRGAGTITMQLARNLYLGHERTLSRKAQEVVLAWILEHLTGTSKRRQLEIYLNIIEWGPGVHGADEACHYYFGHDAGRVSVDEALFLATVVPGPTKWKYRFEHDGTLRAFERAQMHFIGRAMVAKGWLDEAALPPADSLRVDLRGPARDMLMPAATTPDRALQSAETDDAIPAP